MAQVWQLREAKRRLGQVIDAAISDGPQTIVREGEEVAMLISAAEYRRLTDKRQSLSEFFRSSPLAGSEIDLRRDKEETGQLVDKQGVLVIKAQAVE
jgi:antitoxin Phd